MASVKLAAIILNILGIPFVAYALFIANLDAFQKASVWVLVLAFMGARIWFYIVFAKQKKRRNNLEMKKMEKELND